MGSSVWKVLVFVMLCFNGATMADFLNWASSSRKVLQERRELFDMETSFKLPSPLPSWPPGGGFANGTIDLGGLQVSQVSTFNKIWATSNGGPGNLGATFYEPASIPQGFHILGFYGQPNNKPLFGHILVGKDVTNDSSRPSLKPPVDYALVWSSKYLRMKKDGDGYFWLPTPPDGYKAVGYVVSSSPEKPPLDKIRCVRSDLTEVLEIDTWVWGPRKHLKTKGFNVYSTRPTNRSVKAKGATIGGFVVQWRHGDNTSFPSCLKNVKGNVSRIMPNLSQIDALIQAYSPIVYMHPREPYLPSTVDWFFENGALVYHVGNDSNYWRPILKNGANLPQGGGRNNTRNDTTWLDLPRDRESKERIKRGHLQEANAYFHVKPMYGGLFTDIAVWVFSPFNGASRVKLLNININFEKIGEHVGDWEHVTLRISNFNGELHSVFFSRHSWGSWVSASLLEYQNGNKPVAYSALHSHGFYPKPGLALIGLRRLGIGLRDDTAKSDKVMDTGVRPTVVGAEYLGSVVVEPPWVNYLRTWGPKIEYDIWIEINNVKKILIGRLRRAIKTFLVTIPGEVWGEEGPTGPKEKLSWTQDEIL